VLTTGTRRGRIHAAAYPSDDNVGRQAHSCDPSVDVARLVQTPISVVLIEVSF